jgi:hypothetical protein
MHRHRPKPVSPGSPHPARRHAAPEPAGRDRNRLGPLDAADAAFRLLTTGPEPLALNPARLAAGMPDRMVALGELKALLLHPSAGPGARNKVWAELVRRARTAGPAWVIGLTGVAMPGLRRAVSSAAAGYRGDAEDLQAEVLAGFLAALRGLDLDDLDRVPLASRLCWAAYRAGQALACADAGWAARRRDLEESPAGPVMPWGHPDFVLAAAVRQGILTSGQAELIGRNRLEKIPLARIAAEMGISHSALCHRRARAEARLTTAIRQGELSGSRVSAPVRVKNGAGNQISSGAGDSRPGARRREAPGRPPPDH